MDTKVDPMNSQPEDCTAEAKSISSSTVEGNDALCFTAGLESGVIGAGTIHAYLAAGRKCPKVAAGISMGALNAAAMQRVYREMAEASGKPPAEAEAARWNWFRRYVEALSEQPFNVVWNAIPDQSDFFADMIPVRDTSVPIHLRDAEIASRRRLYLLVKLGRWLAQLPVNIGLLASGIVHYVRAREKYPLASKAMSWLLLARDLVWLLASIILHICLSPQFFPEHKFRKFPPSEAALGHTYGGWQRVLGWSNLFSVTLTVTLLLFLVLANIFLDPPGDWRQAWAELWQPVAVILAILLLTWATAGIRRVILDRAIGKKIIFPLLQIAAQLYSFLNAWILIGLSACAGLALYHHAFGDGQADQWQSWLSFGLPYFFVLNLFFAPIVLLPETRRWLVEKQLIQQWPRPLFGWWPYGLAVANVLSLVAYLLLGVYFLFYANYAIYEIHANAWSSWLDAGVRCLLGAWYLLCIPVLPLLPVAMLLLIPEILPMLPWQKIKGIVTARTGWRKTAAWLVSLMLLIVLIRLGAALYDHAMGWFKDLFERLAAAKPFDSPWDRYVIAWRFFNAAASVLMLTWLGLLILAILPVTRHWLGAWMLSKVGLQRSLVHNFHLRLKLSRLFDPNWEDNRQRAKPEPEPLRDDPMPTVIVAASLQTLYEGGQPKPAHQLWAKPGTPLVHALMGALAIPPLFPPMRLSGQQLEWWLRDSVRNDPKNRDRLRLGIDLVDGSVIRQNPLPALYAFLRNSPSAVAIAENNDRGHPAIHVVYGVRIDARRQPCSTDAARQPAGPDSTEFFQNTIVDVGLTSLRLSERRDTQVEVMQSNLISRLESTFPETSSDRVLATNGIFADEIAPDADLTFANSLSPSPAEILSGIAAGCRRTLETLYLHDLSRMKVDDAREPHINCQALLDSLGRRPRPATGEAPGLPEVCRECSKKLRRTPLAVAAVSSASVEAAISDEVTLYREHPQLSGEQPRIVFVASGGVFRGAFHIGMLAALHACNIKPDLIVGASVGTLMGGALGALFCRSQDVLGRLVDTFCRVDDTVALTRTLKSAARELGIRSRAVRLSPGAVRRMVLRGSRSDPGFAAVGAPSALIDAISDLFMIPHKKTSEIAADFIAGQVTGALNKFLAQLRTETIRRLDIEKAVLGTDLLEEAVVGLLVEGMPGARFDRQPFQSNQIAYYGTTTNLCTQSALLLGGTALYPGAVYDFVEAALSSSAFPAVFAPRPESRVFPGTGRPDVYFADGGMFDNLPFIPALELLSRAQRGYRATLGAELTRLQCLERRIAQPDLLIAGALNAVPENDEAAQGSFDSIGAIYSRASSLQDNIKIRSFEGASQRIYNQLQRLKEAHPSWLQAKELHFVDGVVNGAVLPVFPTSPEHLNGTFSFCASTGLSQPRVQKSIADGCYRTLSKLERELASADAPEVQTQPNLLATKAVQAQVTLGRIPAVTRMPVSTESSLADGRCPYFTVAGQRLACPFARTLSKDDPYRKQVQGVFSACTTDRAHQR